MPTSMTQAQEICELDFDGDDVCNFEDECPEQFGPADRSGCPTTDDDDGGDDDNFANEDADGDGIPNGEDACPFVSGLGERYGGVTGTDGCPVDSDGDGVNDGNDQCPFDPSTSQPPCGQQDQQQQSDPQPEEEQQEQEPQQEPLPVLPQTDECTFATNGRYNLNIRSEPTTDSEVINVVTPQQTINATRQNSDETWLYAPSLEGWAAQRVVRTNDACNNLPTGEQDQLEGETGDATIQADVEDQLEGGTGNATITIIPNEDLLIEDAFSGCEGIHGQLGNLPSFVLSGMTSGNSSEVACNYGQGVLETLTFGTGDAELPALPYDQCPEQAVSTALTLRRLEGFDSDLFEQMSADIENADAPCDALAPLPDNLDNAISLAGATCMPHLSDQQLNSLTDSHPILDSLMTYYVDAGQKWTCDAVRDAWQFGNSGDNQTGLYNRLVTECGLAAQPDTLNNVMSLAIANGNFASDVETEALCENPLDSVSEVGESFTVPVELEECPVTAQLLENHSNVLSNASVTMLLNTSDPCSSADTYLETGQIPVDDGVLDGLTQCFEDGELSDLFSFESYSVVPQPVLRIPVAGDFARPEQLISENPEGTSNEDWNPTQYFGDPTSTAWTDKVKAAQSLSDDPCNQPTQVLSHSAQNDPDLIISNILVTAQNVSNAIPYTVLTGERLAVEVTATNIGTAPVINRSFDIIWRKDANMAGFNCEWSITTLTVNESQTVTCDVPGYTQSHMLQPIDSYAEVDPTNNVTEASESNNSSRQSVTVATPQGVDLFISDMRVTPSPLQSGRQLTITMEVASLGNVDPAASTVLEWYPSLFANQPECSFTVQNLTSSPVQQFTCYYSGYQSSGMGTAVIDPNNAIPETNEDNNVGMEFVQVDATPSADMTFEVLINGFRADNRPGVITNAGADLDWTYTMTNVGQQPTTIYNIESINNRDIDQQCGLSVPLTLQPGETASCMETSPAQSGKNTRTALLQWSGTLGNVGYHNYDFAHYLATNPADIQIETLVNNTSGITAPGYQTNPGTPLNWEHTIQNTGDAPVEIDNVIGVNSVIVTPNCNPALPHTLDPNTSSLIRCLQTTTAQAGQNIRYSYAAGDVVPSGQRITDRTHTHYEASTSTGGNQPNRGNPQPTPGTNQPSQPGSTQPTATPTTSPQVDTDDTDDTQLPTVDTRLRGTLHAVFEVDDGTQTDIYALADGDIEPLVNNSDVDEAYPALSPDGEKVAYLMTDDTDITHLYVMNMNRDIGVPVLTEGEDNQLANVTPAWSPDGNSLLVTLVADGTSTVYRLSRDDDGWGQETLIEDATQPIYSPNARQVAFVRESNIYVLSLADDDELQITDQSEDTACSAPTFGKDSLALYFTCDEQLFRHDIDGVNAINITGAEAVANPQLTPESDRYLFDDGEQIYIGTTESAAPATIVDLTDQSAYRVHTGLAD